MSSLKYCFFFESIMGQCCGSDTAPVELKPESTTELKSEIKEESKSEAMVLRRRLSGGSISYGEFDLKEADAVCDMLASKLSDCKVSELNISNKVITLKNETDSTKAVEILLYNKIRAAPVVDNNNAYMGVLDLRDTLKYALKQYKNKLLKKHSSLTLSTSFDLRPFNTVTPDDTVLTVANILATGAHIVGVLSDDGTLLGIVNQGELFEKAQALWTDPTNNCSLQDLFDMKYITSPVKSIRYDVAAFEAFNTMSELHLSGLAVVNDEGKLIHNTSATDIKLWLISEASLEDPIEEFLINIRKQPSATDKYPITHCSLKHTLKRAFQKLYATGYHRLWIVDANNCPIGVFALTDVFKFICRKNHEQQQE